MGVTITVAIVALTYVTPEQSSRLTESVSAFAAHLFNARASIPSHLFTTYSVSSIYNIF